MARTLSALLAKKPIIDHEEVLQACDSIIAQSRNDVLARRSKIIALLKLDRFDDALAYIADSDESLKKSIRLEHAYALYKTGQLEKARELVGDLESRGAKHLEAQASYRAEDFPRARALYVELSENASNEVNDIRINSNATDAQLEWQKQGALVAKRKAEREDLESFETAYNSACSCIARGELAQAEVLLERAKNLCAASEELSEDERHAELLPINTQHIYVLTRLGKEQEVASMSSSVDTDAISDLSTQQIAQINNIVLTEQRSNPYLARRLLHALPPLPPNDQLFGFQKLTNEQNEIALDSLTFKFNAIKKLATRTMSAVPQATTDARLIGMSSASAAAKAQNQLGKLGIESLIPLLEKRPTDVGLAITVVQLYMLTKNHGAAIQVMEKLFKHLEESNVAKDLDVRYAPGMVAVIISLYSTEGRKGHIHTEMAKAASHWRHKANASPALLKSAGYSLLESGDEEDVPQASEIFQTLKGQDPRDVFANAGCVAAQALTETDRSAEKSEPLPNVEKLTVGIDAVTLEKLGMPQQAALPSILSQKRARATDDKPKKKKRIRASKMPKDFDPEKKPDPERWLPFRDRSSYRPKGKKGKQKQAALTQGGFNDKAGTEVSQATANQAKPTVVTGPGSGNKAKKKGRKK